MVERVNKKNYQKPELIIIDDPAFEETGQGGSGISSGGNPFDPHPGGGNPPPGPDGNPNH